MELNTLLTELVTHEGSDLHLVVGQPPVFRIHGTLTRGSEPILDMAGMEALLLPVLSEEQKGRLKHHHELETVLRHNGRNFPLHIFRERRNLAATIRTGLQEPPTLDDLYKESSLTALFHKLITTPNGLIFVTGQAGSGKDTTCAAMLETINRTANQRIVTLEDPINYEFVSKQSVITQRCVGQDVASWQQGASAAFEEDLDIIFISSIHDRETLYTAFALAESGHLVLATLHCETVSEAIARLIEVFPEPRDSVRRMLARNLTAVIAQKLLRRTDRPGRIAANEVLLATPRVRQLIASGQTDLTLAIEAGRDQGMMTMDDCLLQYYRNGFISHETAWLHSREHDRLGSDPEGIPNAS